MYLLCFIDFILSCISNNFYCPLLEVEVVAIQCQLYFTKKYKINSPFPGNFHCRQIQKVTKILKFEHVWKKVNYH